MQTVRAIYEDGEIELLTPIQGVKRAKLIVTVLDDENILSGEKSLVNEAKISGEERFHAAAYAAVTEDDSEEDAIWESYLHVK